MYDDVVIFARAVRCIKRRAEMMSLELRALPHSLTSTKYYE